MYNLCTMSREASRKDSFLQHQYLTDTVTLGNNIGLQLISVAKCLFALLLFDTKSFFRNLLFLHTLRFFNLNYFEVFLRI